MTVKLILVGGFLGSGKRTLLWETARRLPHQGKSVGLITNDQVLDLVDTAKITPPDQDKGSIPFHSQRARIHGA